TLVVDADAYSALRVIPRFTEYQTQGPGPGGGAPIASGLMGQIKGFQVVRSQLVPATVAGGVTTKHNLAFAKDAIAMVMRRLPGALPGTGAITEYVEYAGYGFRITISYDKDMLAQQISIDCLYGVTSLRNGFAVELQS
ncbi:MAG TPA: P22 phage major capsid protein family protein, partial [Bryobacteraceae bacterium]|nr:P22 phage major capsid protein family protein [Bryobacteraceae bacterium]